MNKRRTSLNNYDISSRRFKELCGFVEQYPEWKEKLEELTPSVSSPNMDGMPHGSKVTGDDAMFNLAVKRSALAEKVDMIESTAKDADPELWKYIIQSVAYKVPFYKLQDLYHIPVSVAAFSDRRRYFFYLLSQKKY